MKVLYLVILLSCFTGCSKISSLTTIATDTETERTNDPVYDSQTEVRLLLPWTWFI